jgi:S-(hydroxymethyl)glutathione dehydrogenase/alcohol dehydrogenase
MSTRVSRRKVLQRSTIIAAGAGAFAQQGGAQTQQPGPRATNIAGRKFRAMVRYHDGVSIEELKLLPIQPRDVLIRTQASIACYSLTPFALNTNNYPQPVILNHSGMGVVEEVGAQVKRVQPGDRVIVAGTPECGQCYQCLQGRPDWCAFLAEVDLHPIAEMADGTKVQPMSGLGGVSEQMVVAEEYCSPVFTDLPAHELALLADAGGTGLAAVHNLVAVEPGWDVVVMGAGPVGLSAIQGARIKGAAQIIAVEPIKARREVALQVGATLALDPNAEGANLVAKIRDLCKPRTLRKFAGGAAVRGGIGPDFVIEAVGGDQFKPKVEEGPDPTGILPIRQCWEMVRMGGHIVTHGIGQKGEVGFPAAFFCISGKTFHAGQQGGLHMMRDLPRYVKLIEKGSFNAKAIASNTYTLDQAKQAFLDVADRTIIGAAIVFA